MHCIPFQVQKRRKRSTSTLTLEMLHDFIILTTFLLYLVTQGDAHESFIHSKSDKMKLTFQTGALENIHDTNHGWVLFENL